MRTRHGRATGKENVVSLRCSRIYDVARRASSAISQLQKAGRARPPVDPVCATRLDVLCSASAAIHRRARSLSQKTAATTRKFPNPVRPGPWFFCEPISAAEMAGDGQTRRLFMIPTPLPAVPGQICADPLAAKVAQGNSRIGGPDNAVGSCGWRGHRPHLGLARNDSWPRHGAAGRRTPW